MLRKLKRHELKDGLRVYNSKYDMWGTIKYDKFTDIDGLEWESPYSNKDNKWNFRADGYMCGSCTWSSGVAGNIYCYMIEDKSQ